MSPLYPRVSYVSGVGLLREISFSRSSSAPIRVKIALKHEDTSTDFDSIGVTIQEGGTLRKLVIQSNASGPYDIILYKNGSLFHSATVAGVLHADDSLFLPIGAGEQLSVFIENNSTSNASDVIATLFLE